MSQLVVHAGEFMFQARFEEKLVAVTLLWRDAQKVRFEAV